MLWASGLRCVSYSLTLYSGRPRPFGLKLFARDNNAHPAHEHCEGEPFRGRAGLCEYIALHELAAVYKRSFQSTSGHTLSGWAGIEDHLMKHDLGKINGYVVDIDTLLVFVSLRLESDRSTKV